MSTYNIFISHSWSYSDQYQGLVRLLNNASYFSYKNYSVPKNDPIHNVLNTYELKKAIRNQMQYASCIIILSGVYSTYSKWINIEIELAKEMGKRIIAVQPWGASRTSDIVKKSADEIIAWNSSSIVSAIRGY